MPVSDTELTALAASNDLTIRSTATYDLRPESGVVHVTIDGTATSHTTDTATRIYYFTSLFVPILPESVNLHATNAGATVKTSTKSKTADYTLIEIPFASRLYSGKSTGFRLELDLKDAGGSLGRQVRIGTSLAAFPVWGYGTSGTPGSSVVVSIPAGYTVDVSSGSLGDPATAGDGRMTYTQSVDDASSFFAYVEASKPGAFTTKEISVAVGDRTAPVSIRAWSDDPAWGEQISKLFSTGLPALSAAIGLPYTPKETLVVEETVSRNIGGFAGIFNPTTNKVEIAYFADSFVVLHEAAHVWFNGDLFSDRWIDEAFASYYAERSASKLAIAVDVPQMTASIAAKRIQLNAWADAGQASKDDDTYAYVAAPDLAKAIAKRAGDDVLMTIWLAASQRQSAYQPAHLAAGASPEISPSSSAPDWRGLLDYLEERTGVAYEDLWRDKVLTPAQVELMDQRLAARTLYATAKAAAGDWNLPPAIRDAMGAWDFSRATHILNDVAPALEIRTQVQAAASTAGVTVPVTLQKKFETAVSDFADYRAEAVSELKAIESIQTATRAGTASSARSRSSARTGRRTLRRRGRRSRTASSTSR